MQNSAVSFPINITNFFHQYSINHYSLFCILDIRVNASTSFLYECDVTALPNNRVPTYNCSKCRQKKKGHDCPCKSKEVEGETGDDEFSGKWIMCTSSNCLISPSIHILHVILTSMVNSWLKLFIFKFRSQLDSSESDRYIINANIP